MTKTRPRLFALGVALVALWPLDAARAAGPFTPRTAAAATTAPAPPTQAASPGSTEFIPPIVHLQIPTASTPMMPPPPGIASIAPPGVPLATEGSGSSSPDGLSSIGDLDRGAALWLVIAPRYDLSRADPLTNVDPVAGTGHAKPLPQATEVEIGDHLSLAVPAQVRRNDVPGIDPVTSGSGNRALWFEQK